MALLCLLLLAVTVAESPLPTLSYRYGVFAVPDGVMNRLPIVSVCRDDDVLGLEWQRKRANFFSVGGGHNLVLRLVPHAGTLASVVVQFILTGRDFTTKGALKVRFPIYDALAVVSSSSSRTPTPRAYSRSASTK
jgi:hypothetical protein